MGTIQALLRDPIKRGRYKSRIAAFVDTISTCNLNAIPEKRLTVELCCASDPCHDVLELEMSGTWVKRRPCPELIGRQVKVSMQQTSKCRRQIKGRLKAVHPDGWYEVMRESATSEGGDALDCRVRGTDVDYTVVKTSTAAGVPFSEGRCALTPKTSITTKDEPAFGATFLARAVAYVDFKHERCIACEELFVSSGRTTRGCVHCVYCGLEHARRLHPAPSTSCASCDAKIEKLQEKREEGGPARIWSCVVCGCKEEKTCKANTAPCQDSMAQRDTMCESCRTEADSFMKPMLRELGGLVVGSLQHGKRVKQTGIGDGSMTRVVRRRCLRYVCGRLILRYRWCECRLPGNLLS